MEAITDLFLRVHESINTSMGGTLYYVLIFFGIIALVGQWRLYEKAGLPGYAAIVPIWNFIMFLKLVGRPASHLWLFLIPGVNIYMFIKVWIETAQSFGKTTMLDYVLVVTLNGLYILNLGLSYESRYMGPVYGRPDPTTHPMGPRPSLA